MTKQCIPPAYADLEGVLRRLNILVLLWQCSPLVDFPLDSQLRAMIADRHNALASAVRLVASYSGLAMSGLEDSILRSVEHVTGSLGEELWTEEAVNIELSMAAGLKELVAFSLSSKSALQEEMLAGIISCVDDLVLYCTDMRARFIDLNGAESTASLAAIKVIADALRTLLLDAQSWIGNPITLVRNAMQKLLNDPISESVSPGWCHVVAEVRSYIMADRGE